MSLLIWVLATFQINESPSAQSLQLLQPSSRSLVRGREALSTLNGRNMSYVKLSRRHCFIVNNSNTFFYTYSLKMWRKKRLSAVTHSSNTIHSIMSHFYTIWESEDKNIWKKACNSSVVKKLCKLRKRKGSSTFSQGSLMIWSLFHTSCMYFKVR